MKNEQELGKGDHRAREIVPGRVDMFKGPRQVVPEIERNSLELNRKLEQ